MMKRKLFMSISRFVAYEEFSQRSKLSVFVANLPAKALISIETIQLIPGDRSTDIYRVWYYDFTEKFLMGGRKCK